MRKILIIEDDLIVRSIYRRKFEMSGYKVEVAEDGEAALKLLAEFRPDVIQVDIMLPGIDGVEVIRQIRGWRDIKDIPILVLSSFYRPDLAAEAWKAGATKCVSKMDCTPNLALELVEQLLGGEARPEKEGGITVSSGGFRVLPADSPWEDPTVIMTRAVKAPLPTPKPTLPTFAQEPAVPKPEPAPSQQTTRPTFSSAPAPAPTPAPSAPKPTAPDAGGNADFRIELRQEFLRRAPQIQTELRDRVGALIKSKSTTDQLGLLRELETSVSSLASLAGITGFSRISHISGVLDALIKDLHKKPSQMTASVLRTIAHASDCLNMLFRDLDQIPREIPQSMLILAVDDEPIARRTISVALGKANLRCISMEDPRLALDLLRENAFDLIFLDAEMPGLNGFELCAELRRQPTNKTTPVIFVTSLTKFEIRAQSSLSGGNDLIAKPFLMMELAVKALTYLLKPPSSLEGKTS
jgi:CheY-like chemotaxis protein